MQAASTVWTSKVRLNCGYKMAVKPVDMNTNTITTQTYSDITSREKFLQKFFSSEHQLTLTVIFDTDSGLISLNKTITKGITLKCEICEFSPAKQTCYTVHLIIKVHDINVAESARNLLPNNIYTAGDIRM